MLDEDNTSEELREFLCQYFRNRTRLEFNNTIKPFRELESFAEREGIDSFNFSDESTESMTTAALWDMVMGQVIKPVFKLRTADPGICGFRLTKYGEQLLQGLPIDRPNKYIDYLESQVPNIDSQIIAYVRESLHSYNLGCYFAASVMLGVAAERLFELLVDAYTNSIQNPNAQQQFRQRTANRGISQQYDEFKKKLPDLVGSNGITAEDGPSATRFRQEFKHAIGITFDLIRSYRDYAAHPRDGEVPRHIIKGNLDAFPLFCQRLYQAIEWLGGNGA